MPPSAPEPAPTHAPDIQGVADAIALPLARLAMAHGVPCDVVVQAVETAFVRAAQHMLKDSGLPAHRQVSRIATATGMGRREVARIVEAQQAPPASPSAPPLPATWASEVFTRWVSDRSLRTARGQLKPLKRAGEAPSFEALARSVTQHVHPRSLLDELCRLGLVHHDPERDTVALLNEAFVPHGDQAQMVDLLRDNVGAHLEGAVANVTGDGARPHHDQAVLGDELSEASLDILREHVDRVWQQLLADTVNLMERCIEDDREAGRLARKRMRIGLYTYEDDMPPTAGS
ncbi:MAG: hypothetical protein RI907_576 [Pseudomonadota bacterium]|jgi:hypothetical protein